MGATVHFAFRVRLLVGNVVVQCVLAERVHLHRELRNRGGIRCLATHRNHTKTDESAHLVRKFKLQMQSRATLNKSTSHKSHLEKTSAMEIFRVAITNLWNGGTLWRFALCAEWYMGDRLCVHFGTDSHSNYKLWVQLRKTKTYNATTASHSNTTQSTTLGWHTKRKSRKAHKVVVKHSTNTASKTTLV